MVQFDQCGESTQCAVHDITPDSKQKKINIIVRRNYTVQKVINDIKTQYPYEDFDLVLQPNMHTEDLVYLNDCKDNLIFSVNGFNPTERNILVILPSNQWDGNIKKRYIQLPLKKNCNKVNVPEVGSTRNEVPISEVNGSHSIVKTDTILNNQTKIVDDSNPIASGNGNKNNKKNHINNGYHDDNDTTDNKFTEQRLVQYNIVHDRCTENQIGPDSTTDSLNLSPVSDPEALSDDDLALGASASPTQTEPTEALTSSLTNASRDHFGPINKEVLYQHLNSAVFSTEDGGETCPSSQKCRRTARASTAMTSTVASSTNTSTSVAYVGLVNQAMTCYLNSLLQALFMTPEFRNALYRWEFDNDNELKNIPYQLQKLFLNLQTSKKTAVETTFLTRSFGWDSTEAWQQHDIQELCRVMFDALEHKFRNTKQANLISTLYEGKMIDYVKCLECNTEKARIDTFLDIPLPVRPFGSNVAYGSIEEALRAFVQPETLDANNQYFCEKCNKKCDAHKGLKFMNFPYILTLHLKRFDFDYQTMNRIKLNDKVIFPQTLNLDSFVNSNDMDKVRASQSNGMIMNVPLSLAATPGTTTDDCSTTDSGSAMEEDGIVTTTNFFQQENDINDEDEGIDVGSSTDYKVTMSTHVEKKSKYESSSYSYELFAIMIHSGSASGGHYYAYIKEFDNNEWYCFNDQTVTGITEEDIKKSFGGGSKDYYTSAYSPSTNAYMLMYRQIDSKRNEKVMNIDDFPEHIKTLLPKLQAEDEKRVSRVSRYGGVSDLALPELIKPRVYFYNPRLKKLKVTRVYASRTFDIDSVLDSAYSILNVSQFAPISKCRLVGYDALSEEILQSFENVTDPSLSDIRSSYDGTLDFLLEYCVEGQEFEIYVPGGCTWYVYVVNLNTMEMDGPYLVHSSSHENNSVLQRSIALRLHVNDDSMLLATLPSKKAFVAYDPSITKESQENFQIMVKRVLRNVTYFYLYAPKSNPDYLEILGIPVYEPDKSANSGNRTANGSGADDDVVDAVITNGGPNSNYHISSSQTMCTTGPDLATNNLNFSSRESFSSSILGSNNVIRGKEPKSEDSSLSDGDRTLVESTTNRRSGESINTNTNGGIINQGCDRQLSTDSHSPQLSSPEEEIAQDSYNRIRSYFNGSSWHNDASDISTQHLITSASQFFHAIKIDCIDGVDAESSLLTHTAGDGSDDLSKKNIYKILVDSNMKMSTFTHHVESLIRVPANYFKIQKKHGSSEYISGDNSLVFFTEGETLLVELGKSLEPNEHKAKIFYMRLSELNNETSRLPCVCDWIYDSTMTVADGKRDLIDKLARIDSKYQSLNMSNCRLWLKGGRNPIKILQDNDLLGTDIRTTVSVDFLVQECEDNVNPAVNENSLTLFIRQWHADTMQLDEFHEITLEKDTEIKKEISRISNLDPENISYCKINSSFPCTNISLLSINCSMNWFTTEATIDKYPLSTTASGNVFFYKDSTKSPKELSTEERRDLSAKEKTRLDHLGCVSTSSMYSPRRERALKIYIDSPGSGTGSVETSNVDESTSANSDRN